jgi:hypothetical protein
MSIDGAVIGMCLRIVKPRATRNPHARQFFLSSVRRIEKNLVDRSVALMPVGGARRELFSVKFPETDEFRRRTPHERRGFDVGSFFDVNVKGDDDVWNRRNFRWKRTTTSSGA